MGFFNTIKNFFSKGECENKTKEPIVVCVDNTPKTLEPGEKTSTNEDCDGVIHKNGSASKVHGMTGITSEKDKEWVERNWPKCSKKGSSSID